MASDVRGLLIKHGWRHAFTLERALDATRQDKRHVGPHPGRIEWGLCERDSSGAAPTAPSPSRGQTPWLYTVLGVL